MHRVVITGGPGDGKTFLIAQLSRRGFATVGESARAVIAERLAQGLPPRPDPESFAREILSRDMNAECVCREIVRGVVRCGCRIDEVPRLPVEQRAVHVLRGPGIGGA
jgi:predicted ATPase